MKNKFLVCSLCINSKKLINIYDDKLNNEHEVQNMSIETKISYCLDIKIQSDDSSHMICKKCMRVLDQCYTFKLQAAGVQSFLKNISETFKPNVEPQFITDFYKSMKRTINITTALKSKKRKKLRKKDKKVISESESSSECDEDNDSISSTEIPVLKSYHPNIAKENAVSTSEEVPNASVSSSTVDYHISSNTENKTDAPTESDTQAIQKGLDKTIEKTISQYPCEINVNDIDMNLIDKIIQESGALNELPPDANIDKFLEETTNKILNSIIKFKTIGLNAEPNAGSSDKEEVSIKLEPISVISESLQSGEQGCSSSVNTEQVAASKTCDYNASEIIDIDSDDDSDTDEPYVDNIPLVPPEVSNVFTPLLVEKWATNIYFCSYCSDNYTEELKLKKHVKQCHLNRCIRCRKSFGTKIALKYHQFENMCLRIVLCNNQIPRNCDWKLNYKPIVKLIQFADPNNFKINLTKINKKLRKDVLYSVDFTRQRKQQMSLINKTDNSKKTDYDAHCLRPSTLSSREFSFHNEHVLYYSKVSEHFYKNKFNSTDLNNTTWSSDGPKNNSIKLKLKKIRQEGNEENQDAPPNKKRCVQEP